MKILFSTFGSLGDIHPYIALAHEAKARGHEPILATSERYRPKIEAQNLEFRAIRPDLPSEAEFAPIIKQVMDNRRGPEFLFRDLLVPQIRESYADLLEAGSDADVFITHPAALAGPLAATKLGKKWLSSALAPISTWSIHDPPVPPVWPQLDGWRRFGPLWGVILKHMGRVATRPWVREVEKLRASEGIVLRGNPVFEGQHSPYGTLALFSPHFAVPQRDWPTNTVATGFCFYDAQGYQKGDQPHADANWRTWIEAGEKPVVFTLGSSAVFTADEFLNASRALVHEFKIRAVYLTGGVAKFDSPLRDGELALDYAPFSALFPHAKFVVHQGGVGTTSQALRSGVPQMILPHAHDQPDNAGRIQRLKLGMSVDLERYKAQRVSQQFAAMFDLSHIFEPCAQSLGAKIRAENGPRAACKAIERLF